MGILRGRVLAGMMPTTQKGRTWFSAKKSHAAESVQSVVEPEAGRTFQRQMINLLIGVVTCPSRIADATSDRVGACGTELLNGFSWNTSGWPACSFPSGSPLSQ